VASFCAFAVRRDGEEFNSHKAGKIVGFVLHNSKCAEHCGTFWNIWEGGCDRMALGFVLHERGCGTFWNIVECGGGRDGCSDAEGAEKTRRGGRVLRAHRGPPMDRGVVRIWDPFCAPKRAEVRFSRGFWG